VKDGFGMKRTLVFGLLFLGFFVTGCETGTNGGEYNVAKTIVIQNIDKNVVDDYGSEGGMIAILPDQTTPQQVDGTTWIAAADLSNDDITKEGYGPYTVTIPLYVSGTNNRWFGGGTFDVYLDPEKGNYGNPGYSRHIYRASSVNFFLETTTVLWSSISEVSSEMGF
jgi:hypothetical protein